MPASLHHHLLALVLAVSSPLALAAEIPSHSWPLDFSGDPGLRLRGKAVSAPGVEGSSMKLDGFSLFAVPGSEGYTSADHGFTFTVWVNPYTVDRDQQLIAGKNRYQQGDREWGVLLEHDGLIRLHVQQAGWKTVASKAAPALGHWHLVGVIVESTKAELWIDGELAGRVALTQPVPHTAAPLTLGGIEDGGQIRQPLLGALDEAQWFDRALSAEAMAAMYQPVAATHEVPKPVIPVALWDKSRPLGKAADLPLVEGVEFHVIQKWDQPGDGYTFLHGVNLAWHGGKLYASFAHNKGEENTATEEAQYRVSDDGGKTWGDLRVIDAGAEENLAISHGVFLSHGGRLWAFHGAYTGHMQGIHTRAYSLDEATGTWTQHGVVIRDGFWPLNQPVRMADGNWIMPGLSAGPDVETGLYPPAVAISHGQDLTKWDFISIPIGGGIGRMWGESGVIVDGAKISSIARYGGGAAALLAESSDYGRTWTPARITDLPMATSKPAPGILSTGQHYLVCTTTADTGGRRSPLTIALSRPGENLFSKVWVIRRSLNPGQPGESGERVNLSYPCATEHDGKLYIGYSNNGGRRANLNSAELAVIPISKLTAE